MYADNGGTEFTLPVRANMVTNARWQFVLLYTAPHEAKRRALEDVVGRRARRRDRVGHDHGLPLTHYPLEAAAERMRLSRAARSARC